MIPLALALLLQEPQAGHSLHGEAFNEGPRQRAYRIQGMGDVVFPATTKNAEAAAFVAQGVAQLHSFYYFEAERSFRQAAALDSDLAIAYWGMAMANVNNETRAKGFLDKAVKLRDGASKRERMWIDLLQASTKESDKTKRAKAYVKGVEALVLEFPDDLEARINLAWACWHFKDKGLPIQSYVAIDGLIEQVLAKAPMHSGAHHYKIHLWDEEKASQALGSAEKFGPSAPGIAHAWHMPGHIYTKLNRFADAAWHQEASARVDHAQMIRDRTLPYQIHNYVHNNQWCATSLRHVGRVADAVAIADNLIEIPRHPKLNKLEDGGHACREGRAKLFEILSLWERWDEILERKDVALAPIENADDRLRRLRAVGAALAEKGRLDEARALVEEFEKAEEKDDKRKKAKGASIAEVRARLALAAGDAKAALEQLAKADETPKSIRALLHLRAGDKDKADTLSKEGLSKNHLQPLAARIEVLKALGKPADAELKDLAEAGRFADPDLALLARIGFAPPSPRPLPEAAKKGTSVDFLGPLRWSPVAAPDFALGDFELKTALDQPTVLLFYLGAMCQHCREQLEKFGALEEEFKKAGLNVVAISTETAEEVKRACDEGKVKATFPTLADPAKDVFKAYRCWDDFENISLHGTFLIDTRGRIRWQEVAYTPFMDAKFFLDECRRLLALPR
ncbi:MAG TPA: redoxin domain-containing protein [Planctomycetota bacterium]